MIEGRNDSDPARLIAAVTAIVTGNVLAVLQRNGVIADSDVADIVRMILDDRTANDPALAELLENTAGALEVWVMSARDKN